MVDFREAAEFLATKVQGFDNSLEKVVSMNRIIETHKKNEKKGKRGLQMQRYLANRTMALAWYQPTVG
jgi:hypothetical protein